MRRATSAHTSVPSHHRFQSTLSVRRATHRRGTANHRQRISIHALREESDASTPMMPFARLFQSTLSVRRATSLVVICISSPSISIHALREESDFQAVPSMPCQPISIHALREESDLMAAYTSGVVMNFNPRSP